MQLEPGSASAVNAFPHTIHNIRGVSLDPVSYPVRQPAIGLYCMQHPRRCGISCYSDRSRSGFLCFQVCDTRPCCQVLHSHRREHRCRTIAPLCVVRSFKRLVKLVRVVSVECRVMENQHVFGHRIIRNLVVYFRCCLMLLALSRCIPVGDSF
jgi:hypothetical protein